MGMNDVNVEKMIAKLADEHEIRKTVYDYCYKQDQRDMEGFLSLLTDDIVCTFRVRALSLNGKEENWNEQLIELYLVT